MTDVNTESTPYMIISPISVSNNELMRSGIFCYMWNKLADRVKPEEGAMFYVSITTEKPTKISFEDEA